MQQASLGDRHSAALLVRNRVKEALRVSALPSRHAPAAIYVYTRPVFIDQNRRFLSLGDLVSTIGESAAMGASGAVLWRASADYNDKGSCEALSSYHTTMLNPYVANVTAAAQLCSNFLCQGNGRCVRTNYESDHYLHLSSGNFRIYQARGRYMVSGALSLTDLSLFSSRFTCQCYAGRTCTPKLPTQLSKAMVLHKHLGLLKKTKILNKVTADMAQSTIKENLKTFKH
ncbi:hypothetical protein UPYG_G00343620 [Umbra pygmaea]|uniref:Hyaluronidase n=1 Tax=Umbra pygmaea TaxID=75934 RepID=A0ABD0WBK0_UMBPY